MWVKNVEVLPMPCSPKTWPVMPRSIIASMNPARAEPPVQPRGGSGYVAVGRQRGVARGSVGAVVTRSPLIDIHTRDRTVVGASRVDTSTPGRRPQITRFNDAMREDDLRTCLRVLAELADAPHDDPDLARVRRAVSAFTKKTRGNERGRQRRLRAESDAAVLAATATGAVDRAEGAPLPPPRPAGPVRQIGGLLACYACKANFRAIDDFYHRLCPPCAEENRRRRSARADLSGRRAIVTGGRVKAGFELALKLLRDGAAVTALTRFPYDARRRFAALHDYAEWRDRLTVTGIDLRDIPAVVRWCDAQVAAGDPLDILVNLAAQTVRRPPESYAALAAAERAAAAAALTAGTEPGDRTLQPPVFVDRALPAPRSAAPSPMATTVPELTGSDLTVPEHTVPELTVPELTVPELAVPEPAVPGVADVAGLLPDPSPVNSWTHLVHEVDPVEMLEVQLINVTAPFLLLGRLRPLLMRSPRPRRYVVNVSAVEGQFDRMYKGPEHPHTNMAKAALNMLTRTSAEELAAQGVYLTSVDPGWFTDQQPEPDRERRTAAGFRPPLDVVDAAARVYDPIVRGERGDPPYGCFLKDYRITPW
jgi:NAD(P)-dependent dehydrogenase (short-subunit alcohol dehydrogenase family)